jgi:hypothetical protein
MTYFIKSKTTLALAMSTLILAGCAANTMSAHSQTHGSKMSMESKCACCSKMKMKKKMENEKGCCCGCCNETNKNTGKMCTTPNKQGIAS